jgi:hypothetical protein
VGRPLQRYGAQSAATCIHTDTIDLVVGSSRIDRSSAARLANKTVRIPGDPGMYIVGLDIFHQLHCLVYCIVYLLSWPWLKELK